MAGTGTVLGLVGCLNATHRVEGYIQFKIINGLLEEPGQTDVVSILNVQASHENNEPPDRTHLNEEWAAQIPVPRMPVVSDTLHEALTERFDSVKYIVGTVSPEWAEDGESLGAFNVATTRENFNRVQVHSKVNASSDGTYLTIHSVDGLWNFDPEGS